MCIISQDTINHGKRYQVQKCGSPLAQTTALQYAILYVGRFHQGHGAASIVHWSVALHCEGFPVDCVSQLSLPPLQCMHTFLMRGLMTVEHHMVTIHYAVMFKSQSVDLTLQHIGYKTHLVDSKRWHRGANETCTSSVMCPRQSSSFQKAFKPQCQKEHVFFCRPAFQSSSHHQHSRLEVWGILRNSKPHAHV